jgi:hypothetical protein
MTLRPAPSLTLQVEAGRNKRAARISQY